MNYRDFLVAANKLKIIRKYLKEGWDRLAEEELGKLNIWANERGNYVDFDEKYDFKIK